MSEKDYFLSTLKTFEEKQDFVIRIFRQTHDKRTSARRVLANLLLFRIVMVSTNMITLCAVEHRNEDGASPVIDQTSIAALARVLFETCLMFDYITDPETSEEEWQLRRMVIELHDCTSRLHTFEFLGDERQANVLRERRRQLKREVEAHPSFQNLEENKHKKDLVGGVAVYLKGMRDAVSKAGWDKKYWEAMNKVLSSHIHCHPMSFYRAAADLGEPAQGIAPDHVYASAGCALEYVTQALASVCERMFDLYAEYFISKASKH